MTMKTRAVLLLTKLEAVIRETPFMKARPSRWRHRKRGTFYTTLGLAHVQCPPDAPLNDHEVVVLYVGDDGDLWVRRKSEFHDGRFEAIE